MIKVYPLIIMYLAFFTGCMGQNEQLSCLNLTIQKENNKALFSNLKSGLKDTLNEWIYTKNYKNLKAFKSENWQIDEAIFINPNLDKAVLLVLKQDTVKFTNGSPVEGGSPKIGLTAYDYIDMIYANLEYDGWHFYYQSMPIMVVPRERVNDIPMPLSFEELSLVGRRSILKSYYKKGTCKYNEKFFERWDVKNLKEQHKKIDGYY